MSDHTHDRLVAGCFRCELHVDEVNAYRESLVVARSGVVHEPGCHYVTSLTSTSGLWIRGGVESVWPKDRACRVCLPEGLPPRAVIPVAAS